MLELGLPHSSEGLKAGHDRKTIPPVRQVDRACASDNDLAEKARYDGVPMNEKAKRPWPIRTKRMD